MATATISIEVDDEAARAYREATDEQRRKVELLVSLQLRRFVDKPARSLSEIMDEIGFKAEARGATPEVIEQLFREE